MSTIIQIMRMHSKMATLKDGSVDVAYRTKKNTTFSNSLTNSQYSQPGLYGETKGLISLSKAILSCFNFQMMKIPGREWHR
jgi:hypothetical protein